MAQLAGESVVAVDQLAVCDETAAQSGTEGDHQEIFHALRTAVDHFTYGCRIRVVGDDDRNGGEKALHLFDDIQHALPDEVRCELDRAGIVVAVRGADTDTHQLHFVAGPFEQVLDSDVEFLDILIEIGVIARGERPFADDLTRFVHQSVNGVRPPDIYADSYFFHD